MEPLPKFLRYLILLGAGRVKLTKAFRDNARDCLVVAKEQYTVNDRLHGLQKAELWLALARQIEEREAMVATGVKEP